MKKKLFLGTFCMAIAIVGALLGTKFVDVSSSTEGNLLIENVEALSAGEPGSVHYSCHYNNLAGKWICAWYLSGSTCYGCSTPTNG